MAIMAPAVFGVACGSGPNEAAYLPPTTPPTTPDPSTRACLDRRPLKKVTVTGDPLEKPDDGGPSKQETMEWLLKRLDLKWGARVTPRGYDPVLPYVVTYMTHDLDVVEFEDCKIGIRVATTAAGTSEHGAHPLPPSCNVLVIDFSVVDPTHLEAGLLVEEFASANLSVSPEPWGVKPTGPSLPDADLAKRVAKAFSRMSVLCGGKAEPF